MLVLQAGAEVHVLQLHAVGKGALTNFAKRRWSGEGLEPRIIERAFPDALERAIGRVDPFERLTILKSIAPGGLQSVREADLFCVCVVGTIRAGGLWAFLPVLSTLVENVSPR